MIEQLDNPNHQLTINLSNEVLDLLYDKIKDGKYSHQNLMLNVLTIAIFRVVYPAIKEESENEFIINLSKTLKANFRANRERDREN
ncbi:MAG TPA: hypothetical protein VKZ44_05380 [Taishania sp.]|nr:hypothetical protein [Taishania sp.]